MGLPQKPTSEFPYLMLLDVSLSRFTHVSISFKPVIRTNLMKKDFPIETNTLIDSG